MLKYYFQLIRFPGIFTVFSNILLGYFLVYELNSSFYFIFPLFAISGLLFSAGMIFNDYFDYKYDKKNNPLRPLSSGKISKKSALKFGIVLLVLANLISIFVGMQTLMISIFLSCLILSYNYKLKQNAVFGISLLGLIRFFNVLLGASLISLNLENIFFVIPIGIFVVGLSILARTEISKTNPKIIFLNILFFTTTLVYVSVLIFQKFEFYSIIFLLIFSCSILIPLVLNRKNLNNSIKKIVTFQLIGIILLDAAIISLITQPIFSIITGTLYIPAYLLTRKIQLT